MCVLASAVTRRPTTIDELLPAQLAAALDRVDFRSRRLFAGKMQGERRSKQRGRGVEFEDYRPYVLGDDLRHVDWNVAARLDRLFIRVFQEEQDLSVHLILDASASMDAGTPGKLLFAQRLAMSLGYLALANNNRLSVWTIRPAPFPLAAMEPSRGRRNAERLARFLLTQTAPDPNAPRASSSTTSATTTDFAAALRTIGASRRGKGVAVVLSDFLIPPPLTPDARTGNVGRFAHYEHGLSYLATGDWDVTLVQILSPGELEPTREVDGSGSPTIAGDLRLTDAETGAATEISISPALLAQYRANLNTFIGGLKTYAAARDMTHILAPSDSDLTRLLLSELRQHGVLK